MRSIKQLLALALGVGLSACGGEEIGSGGGGSGGSGGIGGSGGSGGGPDGGEASLGSAQIGIGRKHDPAWVEHFGGAGDDEAMALHASSAGVFLAGRTTSAWFRPFSDPCAATGADAGRDCGDAFVVDVKSGAGIQFGKAQTDETRGVVATSTAVYIAGKSREQNLKNDGWVSELSLDLSTRRWNTPIENARNVDEVLSLAVDGELFVSGGSSAPIGGQPVVGDEDGFVMRLNATGTIVATQKFGSPRFEELMGVVVDAGGVYTTGQTGGYLGLDPSGTNLGSTDVILAVMDRGLAGVTCRADFGTAGKDVGQAIAVTADAIYVTGYTEATMNGELPNGASCNQSLPSLSDAFVSKYDKACNHIWTREFGSAAGDTSDAIASDGEYLYVVGTTGGAADHTDIPDTTDAFLRVYDFDGEVVGEVLFDSDGPGAEHADLGRAVAVHDGIVYVTGRTAGDLGPPGSNLGVSDAFLARIPVADARGNVSYRGTGCP